MTTETTEPVALTDRCGDQIAAVEALLNLIRRHPGLPAPYITVHAPMPQYDYVARFDFQMDSASEFEEWRSALEVPSDGVTLHITASNVWLTANTEHEGIILHLTGFNVPLTRTLAEAPRDREDVAA